MKIIHITDLHCVGEDERLFGKKPYKTIRACVEDINANHMDASFVLITGDLVNSPSIEAYETLKAELDRLRVPFYIVVGNHDDRIMLKNYFSCIKEDGLSHLQRSVIVDNNAFVFLDTKMNGSEAGFYDASKLSWLKSELERLSEYNIYICMHHAPFITHLECMDKYAICEDEAKPLIELFLKHGVKHLFLGHYHRPMCGNVSGISFSCLRGLHHQIALKFKEAHTYGVFEEPQYAAIFIDNSNVVVHYHDFLYRSEEFLLD